MMLPTCSIARKAMIFLLAGGLLYGCLSLRTPPTMFYVLNPLDPGLSLVGYPGRKAPLTIEVSSLRVPQYLERPQIVTRSSEMTLELAEFHQWGGNLRKDMIRVVAKNLSQLLATPHISIFSHRSQASPDFRIELEVMKFERDPDGRVRLSARWCLWGGKDGNPLATRITDLTSPTVQTDSDMEPTVRAMSMLLGELSQIMAETILKQTQDRSDS